MYTSNDCVKLTKEYLKNLSYREQALSNLETDISELEGEIKSISVRSSCISGMPKATGADMTSVERQYFALEEQTKQLNELKVNHQRLANHLQKLHDSIERLPQEQRDLLGFVYRDKYTLAFAGDKLGFSERTCSRKLGMAVQGLAGMLFGACARESLYFIK